MCTVTLVTRKKGYCLGMNRDEKLTRAAGLPPEKKNVNGRVVLAPCEPGGGTWIAVNDLGVTLALINWYAITARVSAGPISRGEVVNAASAANSPDTVEAIFSSLPLEQINAFRLVAVFPATHEITEWRWDLKRLVRMPHRWTTRQWISSGFDEPGAQRLRSATFRKARQQQSAGSQEWLRRLHRSHLPKTGPFSTCMHRADAATVSYTEVTVSPQSAVMHYHAGAPCETSGCLTETEIQISPSVSG